MAYSTPATSVAPEVEIVDQRSRTQARSPQQALAQIRAIADLMDNRFQLPGTNIRFGLDGLIGLVPGIGDAASAIISAYLIYLARDLGAPRWLLARMISNIAIDFAVGSVPLIGDLADVAWKANLKNVRLLERHLQKKYHAK